MNCPECSSKSTVVLNKAKQRDKLYRLYSCPACKIRFQTTEVLRNKPEDETYNFQRKENRNKYR